MTKNFNALVESVLTSVSDKKEMLTQNSYKVVVMENDDTGADRILEAITISAASLNKAIQTAGKIGLDLYENIYAELILDNPMANTKDINPIKYGAWFDVSDLNNIARLIVFVFEKNSEWFDKFGESDRYGNYVTEDPPSSNWDEKTKQKWSALTSQAIIELAPYEEQE